MTNKTKYKRGEVIKVNLGEVGTKQIKGHEQGKVRPCVVIKSLHRIGLLIILPLTSKKPKNISFYHVRINKGIGSLTYDSYVLCHQIRTISTDRIIEKTGFLPSMEINKIHTVLLDLLE